MLLCDPAAVTEAVPLKDCVLEPDAEEAELGLTELDSVALIDTLRVAVCDSVDAAETDAESDVVAVALPVLEAVLTALPLRLLVRDAVLLTVGVGDAVRLHTVVYSIHQILLLSGGSVIATTPSRIPTYVPSAAAELV